MTECMASDMPKERDEKSGRYTESVTDDEIVGYIRERGGVATSDVATEFDYERPSAYRRLKALEEAGDVEAREIGNSLLWEATAPRDDHVTLGDRIDALDVPGSGEKADRRRDAVRAALEYIREREQATPAELKDDVYPDHTGEYASGRSWWKNCVYPALRDLADGDDRLEKADTTGRWSWNE